MVPSKLASSFLPGRDGTFRDGTFAENNSLEGVIDG
jgi:hypothetical protein